MTDKAIEQCEGLGHEETITEVVKLNKQVIDDLQAQVEALQA